MIMHNLFRFDKLIFFELLALCFIEQPEAPFLLFSSLLFYFHFKNVFCFIYDKYSGIMSYVLFTNCFLLSFFYFSTKDVIGKLLINDELRSHTLFKKQSCYIMQNDHLQPLLTVHESMMIAANLKLDPEISHKEKKSRVSENLLPIKNKMLTNTVILYRQMIYWKQLGYGPVVK